MIKIAEASIKDIPIIQQLSNIVWPVTFEPILSKEQIAYMMDMMYSTASLTKQMKEPELHYVLAKDESDNYIGYLSYQHFTEGLEKHTKVHKIYVLPNIQKSGTGRLLIKYAAQKAKENKSSYLTLNVNRYNQALDFYKHVGFHIAKTEDINIGNNFLMEDYVMMMQLGE